MAVTVEGAARQGRQMTRNEVKQIHCLRALTDVPMYVFAEQVGRSHGTVLRALRANPEDWPEVPVRCPPSPSTSHAVTSARAVVRRDLGSGRLSLHDVLVPVHPAIADLVLADVVRLQWRSAGRRAVPALEELGRYALRDRVNLMVAASRASGYSRAWVAEHGSKWARGREASS